MNRKVNFLNKQRLCLNSVHCQKLQQASEVQSFILDRGSQSFCHLFITRSIRRCSKSAQKFAVPVCQVATVVMATTQLILSQFNNFLLHQLRIECGLSLPKMISKCCKLMKLCHTNNSGPVFRDTV